jgi:uncharacterized membrane protein (DUF485 family)
MPGLDHLSRETSELDDPRTARRNARYGLVLFTLYLIVYGGFVLLNAFRPAWMESTPLAGVNLSVTYGLGLILAAFVIALIYGWMCRMPAPSDEGRPGGAA